MRERSRTPNRRAALRPGPPILLAASALLTACATRQGLDLPDIDDWASRQAVLETLDDWEFHGRIGVVAGDDGFSGGVRWAQRRDAFNVTVSGPLGVGTVRLEGQPQTVVLTDKDGVSTTLEDVEAELYARYGWTIPVQSLRYWVLGIPDPGTPADTELDDSGRLAYLEQGGWSVAVTRYGEGGGQSMPTRLTAESGQTRVRLVIHNWLFFDQS